MNDEINILLVYGVNNGIIINTEVNNCQGSQTI